MSHVDRVESVPDVEPGPFECLYCGRACDLSDCEPYCSDDCAADADRENEA